MTAAARRAETIIRGGEARRHDLVWQSKSRSDFVTEVDTSSEAAIREELTKRLRQSFPALSVRGEESWTAEPLPAGLAFIVDPLDGTTNFLHGIPAFSVSIAAVYDGEPIVGLVLDIPHSELFTAVRGSGARVNGLPIRVSGTTDPSRSLIGTGFPFGDDAETDRYARQFIPVASSTAGIRRVGSAAIDLAWLAAGRFEAFWELHLSPWDIAAGILLVREAGGLATGLDGEEADVSTSPLVAGNPSMHAWLLQQLRAADEAKSE
jgi:myo-inositol-1(or 4)-monophosphatase